MHTLYIVCILIDWILVPWIHLTDSELYSTQGILHSILCSCLLLRLRGAYESLSEKGFLSIRLESTSTLMFISDNSVPLANFWTAENGLVDQPPSRHGCTTRSIRWSTNRGSQSDCRLKVFMNSSIMQLYRWTLGPPSSAVFSKCNPFRSFTACSPQKKTHFSLRIYVLNSMFSFIWTSGTCTSCV